MSTEADKYGKVIQDLHKNFIPHVGQIKLGRALFNDHKRLIFGQCGRKFGKTASAIYIAARHALLNPGSPVYIFAPTLKQCKEIYWVDGSLPNFIPSEYIKGKPNNQDLRINLKNGSFIKLDGSEMHQNYRGINPGLVIFDEFKDFHPEFYPAVRPNLMSKKAPQFIIGTPPHNDIQPQYKIFLDIAKEARTKPHGFFLTLPTSTNPHIDKEELALERQDYIDRNEYDVWQREYEGLYVKGGAFAIFPDFKSIVYPHKDLIEEIRPDLHKLHWYAGADPGTKTCFAWLFSAYNVNTATMYDLSEIYETDQSKNSTGIIWPKAEAKMKELYDNPYAWNMYYDEAALWFYNEMISQFNIALTPTHKSWMKAEHGELKPGISLIKDQILYKRRKVSDKCVNLIYEAESYIKNKNGDIPKGRDHLIDLVRYSNAMSNYTFVKPPKEDTEFLRKDNTERLGMNSRDDDDIKDWVDDAMDYSFDY